jgi:methyl-accepting chemotaxis protein
MHRAFAERSQACALEIPAPRLVTPRKVPEMRLSVRTKLFGSFAVVVGLMIVLGAAAIVELGSVSNRADYLGTHSLPITDRISDVRSDTANYRRYQNRLVFATPEELPKFLHDMQPYATDATKVLASYAALADGGAATTYWRKTKTEWAHYLRDTAGFNAAIKAGNTQKAKAIISAGTDEFTQLTTNADKWNDANLRLSAQALAAAHSTYSTARTIVLGLLAIATLVAAGLAFAIARAITGGVRKMLRAAEGISEGDLEQDVHTKSRDEIGDTARAFERMISYLQDLAGSASRIAGGDLTVDVEPKSERDVLGVAFRTMSTNLRALVTQVSGAAQNMSTASGQMSTTSEETSRAVEEIARAVQDVATGAERQVQMVHTTRESAEEGAQAAERAREVADQGVVAAEQATAAMAAVKHSSPRWSRRSTSSPPSRSRSAASSRRSSASPGRPTC